MTTLHEPKTIVLLNAARSGDQEAWEKLYARYRAYLIYVLQMRLRGQSKRAFDEEDVLQSAFASAYQSIGKFEYQGEGSLLKWLTRIVQNEFLNRRRAHEGERRRIDSGVLDGPRAQDPTDADAETPSQAAVRAEMQERVRRAFSDLDPEDQMILGLRYGQQLSFAEIGEVLECARTTATERFARAVNRLSGLTERRP